MTAWPYILTIGGALYIIGFVIYFLSVKYQWYSDEVMVLTLSQSVLAIVLLLVPGIIGFSTYNNTNRTTHTEQVYILPKTENGQSIIYKRDKKMVVFWKNDFELSEKVVNIYNFVEDEKVEDGKVVLHTDITQTSEVDIYYNVWRKHYDKKYEYHINHKTLMELRGN